MGKSLAFKKTCISHIQHRWEASATKIFKAYNHRKPTLILPAAPKPPQPSSFHPLLWRPHRAAMPGPLTRTWVRMGLGHELATSFRETGPGREENWGGKRWRGLIPSPERRHRAGEQGAPEGTGAEARRFTKSDGNRGKARQKDKPLLPSSVPLNTGCEAHSEVFGVQQAGLQQWGACSLPHACGEVAAGSSRLHKMAPASTKCHLPPQNGARHKWPRGSCV